VPNLLLNSKWKEVNNNDNEAKNQIKNLILYGIDAIHGSSYTAGATLFPQQIGIAATFNTEIAKKRSRNISL
jgi:beta-glucosidase